MNYFSAYNPALSLPSSSIFLNPFNQSDSHKIEESDSHHNNKGDIAD
jgi:hypothetical protein